MRHIEVGVKTEPFRGVTANVTAFNTDDQGLPGAGRQRRRRRAARLPRQRREGARARRRVRRAARASTATLSFYGAAAYTDGRYVSFRDAPPPLEDTGGPQVEGHLRARCCRASRSGRSRSAASTRSRGRCSAAPGELFGARRHQLPLVVLVERERSRYLVVDGYSLRQRARRLPLRPTAGRCSLWSRNLLDKDYYELLTAAPGNTGLYVGQPGDGRTVGVTLAGGAEVTLTRIGPCSGAVRGHAAFGGGGPFGPHDDTTTRRQRRCDRNRSRRRIWARSSSFGPRPAETSTALPVGATSALRADVDRSEGRSDHK